MNTSRLVYAFHILLSEPMSHTYPNLARRCCLHSLAIRTVLDALRSSRAALLEHLIGTDTAIQYFDLPAGFKKSPTGDVLRKLHELARRGPPQVRLDCPVPSAPIS
ncbi:hypothetical protein SAMN05216215_102849 [Saccharopolyspora shandongensis]|uniref:Uncharacterized protein n=1 Tax=Saccharopolyspora shandongensis TaxID=418495 RepID=A0A1H3KHU1_9PSEU|nr:hypothetical protein SAMN05216215_102849 [Saccharopolyspora shandongensis]